MCVSNKIPPFGWFLRLFREPVGFNGQRPRPAGHRTAPADESFFIGAWMDRLR